MSEPSVPPSDGRQAQVPAPRSSLSVYVETNIDRYSADALVAAALAAGYPEPEVMAAIEAAAKRRRGGNVNERARWLVYGAYLVTYLLLSAGLLIPPESVPLDLGWGAWYVLTGAAGLAFLVSFRVMGRATTTAAVLGVPLVLLVIVGGLCVYTTGTPLGLLPT